MAGEPNAPMTNVKDYLRHLKQFEIEPGMIDQARAIAAADWIAANLDRVNGQLYQLVLACQDCFHPTNRPLVQIFAVPLHPACPVDGFCHLASGTIVVDPGRVVPEDWLKLVAHEYAHLVTGVAGHSPQFARILAHLCLGLDLVEPEREASAIDGFDWLSEAELRRLPLCRVPPSPTDFWGVPARRQSTIPMRGW
jgi:hypothetical protein